MAINLTPSTLGRSLKEYVIMTLGMFCYAFGWVACIIPAGGMGGGATGLSMILNHFFPMISMGTFVFIINAILLLFGGFIVGWNFGIKTIFCITMLSIAMDAWTFILPENYIEIVEIYTQNIDSSDILLVIMGAVISGSGVAIGFSQGGSTGGTDIVAMIINNYRTVSYGKIVRAIDSVIIGAAILLPASANIGIDGVIYGFVMTAVLSYTVDMLMTGNQQSNQIMIVCKDSQQMADAMTNIAHRGATVLDAKGWYSKNQHNIVMVVCRKRDTSVVLKIIKEVDPDAFITVGSVMGVYGKGFDALSKI